MAEIFSCSQCFNGVLEPLFAEAYSIRDALKWLVSNPFLKVVIESDALDGVNLLQSGRNNLSYLSLIIDNCKVLCMANSKPALNPIFALEFEVFTFNPSLI